MAVIERVFRVWLDREDAQPDDFSSKQFYRHLELLTESELLEVERDIPLDKYWLGWKALDNTFQTRTRRDTLRGQK